MSAFGGKADIDRRCPKSAFDPKRTSLWPPISACFKCTGKPPLHTRMTRQRQHLRLRPTAKGARTIMTTFVLVHGAWHGGWRYKRVARLLRQAGHEVYTPTLT